MSTSRIDIIRDPIFRESLLAHLNDPFPEMVKCVVDVGRGIMALGGEPHADAEELLLDDGSRQQDLWGANIYPGAPLDARLEFTALINIRPSRGNRSMDVQDARIREQMRTVIERLVEL